MTIKSMGMVSRKVCYEAGYDKAKQEIKCDDCNCCNAQNHLCHACLSIIRDNESQQAKQDIFQKILEICNKGNARQNHIGKFFEIRRLCQEELGEEK